MPNLDSLILARDAAGRLHLTLRIDFEKIALTLEPDEYAYIVDEDDNVALSFTLDPARARAKLADDGDHGMVYVDTAEEPIMTKRQFRAMLDLARDEEPHR